MTPWDPRSDPAAWKRTPLAHVVSNLTTHSLERVESAAADGPSVSYVAKTLRPASESAVWATIPPEHHASTLEALNWLDEPRVYGCGLAAELPDGLRMPVIHHVDQSSRRITIWMEDVANRSSWDLDRYRRTAEVLGRLNGAWTAPVAAEQFALGGRDVGDLFFGKICNLDLPLQREDSFWAQPEVAVAVGDDHRRDLFALAEQIPAMIGALDAVPRGVCHGDATPGNFLESGDGSIVAIDWAFGNIDAIGSDLAQLLAGRYESGDAEIADLCEIVAAVDDGYGTGLVRAGATIDVELWRRAWATHLAVRSVFSALVVEPGGDRKERLDLLRKRAALARFGMDFARRYVV